MPPGGTALDGTWPTGDGEPGIIGVGVAFGGKGVPGNGGIPAPFGGGVGSTGVGAKVCPGPGTELGAGVTLFDADTFAPGSVTVVFAEDVALPAEGLLDEDAVTDGGPAGGGTAEGCAPVFIAPLQNAAQVTSQPNVVLIEEIFIGFCMKLHVSK
jgi:hypothetical protein